MDTVNISSARQDLFSLAERTIKTSVPVTITSKNGNVVMLSEEDYLALQETVYLSGVPGLVKSILEAEASPDDEFVDADKVDWDV